MVLFTIVTFATGPVFASVHVGVVDRATGYEDIVANDDIPNWLHGTFDIEASLLAWMFVDDVLFKNVVCSRSPGHERLDGGGLPGGIAHHDVVEIVPAHDVSRSEEANSVSARITDAT